MRSRTTVLALVLWLAIAADSLAQSTLSDAASALRSDSVYVDPDAERALSEAEADSLRDAIARARAGPLYLAVLPDEAAGEAGGDPGAALREIAVAVGEPGTYAAVIGDSFRAGATGGVLPEGVAGELASQALESGGGTAAVLEDFVRRVGDARSGEQPSGAAGGDSDSGGIGSGFLLFFLVLLAAPLLLLVMNRRRARRQQEADTAQLREVARDDLVALGDDIRALDLDVQMPGVDEQAKSHYGIAVERYQQAEEALDAARRPQDIERVTALLEEGRWAMTAARARLAGESVPERRPPCFFDPRHGPSVGDVEWAPPGGLPRPVPVCAADATRIEEGLEPNARQVAVNGQMVPYWQAGPVLAPWAGGFFGGGLLPGLFIGSMLGGAFGGFGAPADVYAHDADFGDFGGGGDFGGDFGGGGDFG